MKLKIGEKNKKKEKSVKSKGTELGQITNWIQRFKQNIDSLERRVDAIEKRLSGEPFKMAKFGGEMEYYNNDFSREYISKLEKEISALRKNIEEIKNVGVPGIEETGKEVIISLRKKEAGRTIPDDYTKELASIERRLERLEKSRKTAIVKVGKIEVPFEVTGLIGGFLAFLIAILLLEGYKELVISPPFVMFIGLVLLISTALKTYLINASKR